MSPSARERIREGVFHEVRIAWVVEHSGESLGQADALVELAWRQQAGVGGERRVGDLDVDGQGLEKVELVQCSGLRIHGTLRGVERGLVGKT